MKKDMMLYWFHAIMFWCFKYYAKYHFEMSRLFIQNLMKNLFLKNISQAKTWQQVSAKSQAVGVKKRVLKFKCHWMVTGKVIIFHCSLVTDRIQIVFHYVNNFLNKQKLEIFALLENCIWWSVFLRSDL